MTFATKMVVGLLLVAATGVPVVETSEALVLTACLLALVFGVSRPEPWRLLAAGVALVIAVISINAVLPRADIAEAHNAFLVLGEDEPLQQGLPPEIYESWKRQFDALYPPDNEPYETRSSWRRYGVPKTLFTRSSDAIWREAKYTRQVDNIRFRSLGEFRGGFGNELQYNWWDGELRRESMPFYVMYELTQASVGSRLVWKGQVFWERPNSSFEEIVHLAPTAREISSEDAGKRVYAAFFPTPGMLLIREGELYFSFEPSGKLRVFGWLEMFLSIATSVSVLALTIRVRWSEFVRVSSILAASYLVMVSFISISLGKYLGKSYPPHGGGDDGLAARG